MRNDFAIFILSHGRADSIKTIDTLAKCNYTGKWYIVCDNEDETIDRYYKNFGNDKIIIFDKLAKSKEFDTGDLSNNRKAIVYARNACFDIAEQLNLTYFLELDDDYTEFRSRTWNGKKLNTVYCRDLDSIIDEMIEFLDISGALTIAFAQTGDFIGGVNSRVYKERLSRKAMNSFFCKTCRKFDFLGRINEDVNSYTYYGSIGQLMFTVADMTLNQQDSQQRIGGMSELYLASGTFIKSFFTVMYSPSCVKVAEMGCEHKRIHHLVDWKNCVPKIISDRFKVK